MRRLETPTRLTMRRTDFSLRRWDSAGVCAIWYAKWDGDGQSVDTVGSFLAVWRFCLWNFVNLGQSRWVAFPDGYKRTRGDWGIAADLCE